MSETRPPVPAILDFTKLEARLDELSTEYQTATPFPHIILDDVLEPEAIAEALTEFPTYDGEKWISYTHVNERKFGQTDPTTWGPTLQAILEEFNSPRFMTLLERLTGIHGLFPDPTLEGGGLHQSTNGGYLNIHADFTVHPQHRHWQRRVNLLLYLNADWKPEYGGDLELWEKDMSACADKVAPIANRVVIFSTNTDSFHGHPTPMTLPDGVARQSMALYYFTEEDHPLIKSTEYRARPEDAGTKTAMIYADKQLLRAYDFVKRHLGLSDDFASNTLAKIDRFRKNKPSS